MGQQWVSTLFLVGQPRRGRPRASVPRYLKVPQNEAGACLLFWGKSILTPVTRPGAPDDPSPPTAGSARYWFGFRFTEPLTLLRLTCIPSEIFPLKVRHGFGFGNRSVGPSEKPLRFFNSPTQWQRVRGPHNPLS